MTETLTVQPQNFDYYSFYVIKSFEVEEPKTYKNVASFKRSIKKSFTEDMIIKE